MLLMQRVQSPSQTELFTWNVALHSAGQAIAPSTDDAPAPRSLLEKKVSPSGAISQDNISKPDVVMPNTEIPRLSPPPDAPPSQEPVYRTGPERIPHPLAPPTGVIPAESSQPSQSESTQSPKGETLPPPEPMSPFKPTVQSLTHESMTSSKESPVTPQLTERTETASLSAADHPQGSKVDYGWLAKAMAQWIEGLDKRYPAMLRTEGVQGKVTLIAMLHDNGTLSDIRVAKSSGNMHLDDVAVEDVRNGPPVRLSRLLDRPHMSVRFSIVYDLRTAP